MTFPEGLNEFFWISDRDGWQHIYRYDYAAGCSTRSRTASWSVTRIEGVDAEARTIYYVSTEASPLQRQLYAIRFDGSGPAPAHGGARGRTPSTCPPTRGTTSTAGPTCISRARSSCGRRAASDAEEAGGQRGRDRVARDPRLLAGASSSPSPRRTAQRLDGSIIKPPAFDSTHRYPVIFTVYGGPGSQGCTTRSAPAASTSGTRRKATSSST